MTASLILAMAAGLCAPTAPRLHYRATADVQGQLVMLSDIADLSGLPPSYRTSGETIAVLVATGDSKTLLVPREAVSRRLQGLAPAFGCLAPPGDRGSIAIRIHVSRDLDHVAPRTARSTVKAGQELQLVTSSGPVHVARKVTVVQPAKSGQRLFVRTSEGQLISARFENLAS